MTDLDYRSLLKIAQEKAKRESEFLYPFYLHKQREKAYAELTHKYYMQYITPPRNRHVD